VVILIIALPIMVGGLVTAENTSGASTNFTQGLAISNLLVGLAPVGALLGFFRLTGRI